MIRFLTGLYRLLLRIVGLCYDCWWMFQRKNFRFVVGGDIGLIARTHNSYDFSDAPEPHQQCKAYYNDLPEPGLGCRVFVAKCKANTVSARI